MGVMEDAEKALKADNGAPVLEKERIFGESDMPTDVTKFMLTTPKEKLPPVLDLQDELPDEAEPSKAALLKELEELSVVLDMLRKKVESLREVV
jgi:hypothetical protein